MYYLALFVIPLLVWIAIAKIIFKHEFSLTEMGFQAVITSVVLLMLTLAASEYQTRDTKIVNGVVSALTPKKQSCNQMWSDWQDSFCTNQDTRSVRDGETCTTINNKRTCTPKYKTQYRSVFPWERRYFVATDINISYEIDRVDAQGATTPPRFAMIKLNDPVSITESYTNYIKGAADTLFNQKYEDVPPIAYPKVYDYYNIRRVIYFGTPGNSSFVEQWNKEVAKLNSDIRKTGANVIINVVGGTPDWAERLAQAWDAHNINDVVVTIGVQGDSINWVDVRSWSKNDLVDIEIRDEIMNLKVVDKTRINDIIKKSVETHYEQQSMEDFAYLAEDIPPPTWLFVIVAIILLVVTPLTTLYFSNPNNPF